MRHLLSISFAALFVTLVGAARADTVVSTSTFNYTGGSQSYVVPGGADYIVIKVWAAGGGAGISNGGGGGFVTSTFAASPGVGLTVNVGGAGANVTGGWPGGGNAAGGGGAGGGGYSRVTGPGVEVVAGAGGGGGNGGAWNGVGGGGGGPNGEDGGGPGSTYGRGSTPGNAGAGGSGDLGTGDAGSYWQGGKSNVNDWFIGGGGGGGYIGGGGGGTGTAWNGGGGGGGGSCYVNQQTSVTYYQAHGYTPGGTADPDYPGNAIAYGGYEYIGANGHNGYVLIRAYKYASAPVFDPASYTESFNCNQSVSYQVHAGGIPAPTYSASGLPAGYSINSSTGVISGQCSVPGTYNAIVYANNSVGQGQANFTCTINAPAFTASVTFSNSTPIPGDTVTITRTTTANFGVLKTENTMWRPGGAADVMGIATANQTMTYSVPYQTGKYTYTIRVVDSYSNYKDFDFNFTAVTATINPPTNVQATNSASTFVSLSWTAAIAQAGVNHYNVYRDGTYIGPSSTTSFTDTTASPSTSYSYTVYAVDNQGNVSSASQSLNVITARALEVFTPLP